MESPVDILSLTGEEFAAKAAQLLPSGAGVAPKLYAELFSNGAFTPEKHPMSAASIAGWREHFHASLLTVARVVEETNDLGTTAKAILRTRDGHEIECVRIPMGDTQTLCLSSQVGCRMGCTFCETGRMGLLRHLTAAEIVAEVVTVRAQLGWQPRNLVFMGMGEALDNAENVIQALKVLSDKRGYHYSQERLTICTSGHADGVRRLAELGWKRLNLSISLNAATDAQRSTIMPVNRKTPLAELQKILAAYPQRRNFTLVVNYCLLPGINDARTDATNVAEFCRPLSRVLLNLIPYNPGTKPLTRPPTEPEVEQFIAWLREEGVPVRRRVTKGRSIMAACGQLGDAAAKRKQKEVVSSNIGHL